MFAQSYRKMAGENHESRLADVLIVTFDDGPGSVRDQDQLLTDAVDRLRKVAGVESTTVFAALPVGGAIHRPPISVPGVGEPRLDGTPPSLDRGDTRVIRHSSDRYRSGSALYRGRRSRRAGRDRQRDDGASGVAGNDRHWQVPSDRLSVERSGNLKRAIGSAGDGALPGGRRHRARLASSVFTR